MALVRFQNSCSKYLLKMEYLGRLILKLDKLQSTLLAPLIRTLNLKSQYSQEQADRSK
jgi:hypothetical protein